MNYMFEYKTMKIKNAWALEKKAQDLTLFEHLYSKSMATIIVYLIKKKLSDNWQLYSFVFDSKFQ